MSRVVSFPRRDLSTQTLGYIAVLTNDWFNNYPKVRRRLHNFYSSAPRDLHGGGDLRGLSIQTLVALEGRRPSLTHY